MIINKEIGLKAIYGGLFLGGGGGGSLQGGMEVLDKVLQYGTLELQELTELQDHQSIVTASLVGSPASKEKYVGEHHYHKVYENFQAVYGKPIDGVVTNEMGAQSITNGWILSVITKIPLIDAPCNGRAHPTGTMGSMGLSMVEGYESLQAAAGGKGERNIDLIVRGPLNHASAMIRNSAILAGGFVTVLRNPIEASYVKENAAIGSIQQAMEIGEIFIDHVNNPVMIQKKLQENIGLEILCEGSIGGFQLTTQNGFDIGTIQIKREEEVYEIVFWNEYMTVEKEGKRLATFPDLIAILDKKTGIPLTSPDIIEKIEVTLVKVPRGSLKLGRGMFDKKLFEEAERVIQKNLVNYIFQEGE